jgi:type I restriction enzyme M protein
LQTRKYIIENHKLQGVVSLPSGVFQPYSGVSTSILFFSRTDSGGTESVWFYDMMHDGFSLNANRTPIDENDIPDVLKKWKTRNLTTKNDRKSKAFFVPKSEIVENDYELSINRYKEIEYEEIQYASPKEILVECKTVLAKITKQIEKIENLLD